jgi:hypothetical protein
MLTTHSRKTFNAPRPSARLIIGTERESGRPDDALAAYGSPVRSRIRSCGYWEVRQELLSSPLATETLGLRGTRLAARMLSGDPRDLRLFGMGTLVWYSLGIRISGRTAVEVTRDPQAKFLARAAADTLRDHGHEIGTVVDPFVGSGNVLHHLVRTTKAERGIGIDANRNVVDLTRRNFARLGRLGKLGDTRIELHEGDWSRTVELSYTDASLVVLHPPWGEAYTDEGLDLRRTVPPILELLAEISRAGGDHPLFALVHTVPHVVDESVDEIRRTYETFATVRPDDPEVAARIDYLLVRLR